MQARLDKLRRIMRANNIDIMALIPGANLRYLTGGVHYVMERPIVMFIALDGQPLAVIPKMEIPVFARHSIQSEIISWTDAEGYNDAFRQGLDRLNPQGKTIGVEGFNMRFAEGEVIRQYATGATVTGIDDVMAELRIHKDADEIASLRKAIDISQQGLQATLDAVRVGMSEIEVALMLEDNLRQLGTEGFAFDTILHAGGNTALPHMGPLDYRIQAGDPLLIDFGGIVDGYRADITRTVFVGEPKPEFIDFYNVVKSANAKGRETAKAGITAGALDVMTKQVLIDAGYEHLIRARTGHGLGLETHEPPYIVEGNQQVLEAGMVFTIEPGIYDDNRIGVRIEDDVLITENGAESLTTFTRDVLVVGE